ncbi:NAD(P)-dependent alcohol dehydrogenase [Synechococcus sp. PCC 7336]|uniref:NAD(P)-dependent alcohol dehydrogenase n=1 Tax=Synechococcus sp. PCC 7336 TaxID=195250 RepID=UPI0004773809|nr:NAD(P)-dependent alcohol dehydrogenase [Synechococcus sp. PCC 7336]
MKAIVIHKYGSADVLQYEEIPVPSQKPDDLLVKVRATSVNPIDWKIRNGMFKLLPSSRLPLVLGSDFAGEVVSVGKTVAGFRPGDSVYGFLGLATGAYAEYVAVPAQYAALKPKNLSYEAAAAVPLAATTALQALRNKGKLQSGQTVLINGASGGVGTFAVQIAKALGARVTGVCSSKNIEFVKSLGCDRAIDYTQQDFTTHTDTTYDIVFDAVAKQSFSSCRSILHPKGTYITTLPTPGAVLQGLIREWLPGPKARSILARPNNSDLSDLKQWIEGDRLRPILDRTYPLSEVATAHTHSERGHTVGKIAIAVAGD